jgi:hypothetical protein
VICITRRQCKASDTVPEIHCASTEGFDRREPKMRLINVLFLRTISEIKLKRTDTTLDLSQKACNTLLAVTINGEVDGARLNLQRELKKEEKEKEYAVEEADICSFLRSSYWALASLALSWHRQQLEFCAKA